MVSKKKDKVPKGMYLIIALIFVPGGGLFAFGMIQTLIDMMNLDYDFSRKIIGGTSGKTAHYIAAILLLFGSSAMFFHGLRCIVAIINNEKIKDD